MIKTNCILFILLLHLSCAVNPTNEIGRFKRIKIQGVQSEPVLAKKEGEHCNYTEAPSISQAAKKIIDNDPNIVALKDVTIIFKRKILFFLPFFPFLGFYANCYTVIGIPVYRDTL